MRKNFKDVGFYPQPVLIIGTYDADGVPDAMNVGWGGLVGGGYVEINISQGHKTTENLSLKGAFTVSFADRAHLTEADYVGLVSGHTTPDKIARAGLTPVRSAFVDAPLFEEFPLTLECQVVERSDGPGGVRIGVMNLIGRCEMDSNFDNPFTTADRVLRRMEGTDVVLVDFHAEATSEKGAMGYYLDGRAQAVWGTHTHVPTADGQILPQGTGFITDLGMTGPARSILGVKPENSVARFLGQLPRRYEAADGPNRLGAVLFTIDTQTKRCCQVTRTDLTD